MTYWILSMVMIVFGFVTGFSIGPPFALVGLAMLVLGSVRTRPRLFWPPMLAVIAFEIGYLLIAPLYCTATTPVGGVSSTVCSNILGIGYGGTGLYNLSLLPAIVAGLACAAITALVVTWLMWRRSKTVLGPTGQA